MQELSIVASVVGSVMDSLAGLPRARVLEVRLRIGVLQSVEQESLSFCWEVGTQGTPLAGSKLVIKPIPVGAYCAACAADVELEGVQSFRCPNCGDFLNDLRRGRELEIDSIEIDDGAVEGEPAEAEVWE